LFTRSFTPPEKTPFTLDQVPTVAVVTDPLSVIMALFAQTSGTETILAVGAGVKFMVRLSATGWHPIVGSEVSVKTTEPAPPAISPAEGL
jgi:hypothetical protein